MLSHWELLASRQWGRRCLGLVSPEPRLPAHSTRHGDAASRGHPRLWPRVPFAASLPLPACDRLHTCRPSSRQGRPEPAAPAGTWRSVSPATRAFRVSWRVWPPSRAGPTQRVSVRAGTVCRLPRPSELSPRSMDSAAEAHEGRSFHGTMIMCPRLRAPLPGVTGPGHRLTSVQEAR